MAAVMIEGVDERGVLGHAFGLAEVEPGVGPFLTLIRLNLSTLPLVCGRYGRVRLWVMEPRVWAKSFDLYGDPLSVNTRRTVIPQPLK